MDEINNRFKEIRKSLDKTQTEFATIIGLSQSSITMIERGDRPVADRHIKIICALFNVSERWLRTGDGDMYVRTENSLINQLKREYNLDERRAAAIESFLDLNPEMQDALLDGIFALADNIKSRAADRAAERSTAHQLLDQEMDAEEKAASASLATGSNAEDKRA